MKRNIFYLLSLAVVGGTLVGCDTDETACSADAECGGFACVIADGETAGVCASTCADGCAVGYRCGTDATTGAETCEEVTAV